MPPHDDDNASLIGDVLRDGRLIVCCGPGGVGKTTTSAALGLRGALMGRKVIVLTIDPAKRLANSLGLSELSSEPQRIDLHEHLETLPEGAATGEMWAMMLDQEQALNDLVGRFAPDAATAERSRRNNIYRLLSSALHGMQEYMALDKLHDLYTGGYFDLVVLDTPPTKNALEFLETPSRARTFFDERIVKWFLPDKEQPTSFFRRVLNPGSVVLKLISGIFGEHFVNELAEFFETLYFLQATLHSRGEMIDFILRDQATFFMIITSADPRRMKEAIFFHEKLGELDQRARAFVINRVIPSFVREDIAALEALDAASMANIDDPEGLLDQLRVNYHKLARVASRERDAIGQLASRVGQDVLRLIPILGEDVHDIEQLIKLSAWLTPLSPSQSGT